MATHNLQPITKEFLTYNSKTDASNSDQRFLSRGSKNVFISDLEKFKAREGYALLGSAGTTGVGIKSSTEWQDCNNNDYALEADGTTLKVLINSVWQTLMDGLTSVNLIFDPYWDDTEKIDRLLWVDGTTNMYDWSGAVATLSAITATTVTLQGVVTFGELKFLTQGTRAIRIKDDNGTWHRTVYTGGESTTTLTGLATDLTSFPFTGGNLIVQEVITHANTPDASLTADFLRVIDNQVWVGSRTSNKIFVSKNTSVIDYTFSTPRAVGEGAQLTLDGPGRAVDSLKGDIILFAGTNYIYKSQFNQITVGSTLAETIKVERIKTTSRQSALHQNLVANIGNGLTWIGYDNVLYKLVDATLAYNPDLRNVSDPIKPDFDATDFTGGHIKMSKNRVLISAPASSVNFIYEFRLTTEVARQWFWQPPFTIPVARWAIINGILCAHSSATNETYTLFTGYNDNGAAINSIAKLMRWNGGVRDMLKACDEMFNEGAISLNTTLNVMYDFDKDGGDNSPVNKLIEATNEDILFLNAQDPSLGNNPDGDISLSGDVTGTDNFPKFRIIHEINEQEFFDYGVTFYTNDIDYRWEILAHGSNSSLSTAKATAIKN